VQGGASPFGNETGEKVKRVEARKPSRPTYEVAREVRQEREGCRRVATGPGAQGVLAAGDQRGVEGEDGRHRGHPRCPVQRFPGRLRHG